MRANLMAGALALPLLALPAAGFAADLKDYTWKAYGGDGDSASVMVVAKSNADNPEAHYAFFLSCVATDQWMMNVSDVDAKALGTAIADGKQPTFGLVIDDKPQPNEDGDFYPDIVFNQADNVWEYSTTWDISLLDDLMKAKKIALRGTGVDVALPTDGMTGALQDFKGFCDALQATDEGESDDLPPDVPEDNPQ